MKRKIRYSNVKARDVNTKRRLPVGTRVLRRGYFKFSNGTLVRRYVVRKMLKKAKPLPEGLNEFVDFCDNSFEAARNFLERRNRYATLLTWNFYLQDFDAQDKTIVIAERNQALLDDFFDGRDFLKTAWKETVFPRMDSIKNVLGADIVGVIGLELYFRTLSDEIKTTKRKTKNKKARKRKKVLRLRRGKRTSVSRRAYQHKISRRGNIRRKKLHIRKNKRKIVRKVIKRRVRRKRHLRTQRKRLRL